MTLKSDVSEHWTPAQTHPIVSDDKLPASSPLLRLLCYNRTRRSHGSRAGSELNFKMATMYSQQVNPKRLSLRLGGCALLCFLAAGCGEKTDTDGPRRLRMGHVYEVKNPTHEFGAAHINDRLQAAGVNLELSVYPASQLGSEAELLEQLVAGELDMALAGPSFLGMWYPPVGVFDAAYVFQNLEHMLEVAQGELMRPHWEELRLQFGVRVLGTWAYGVRHITGNRPIRHPDDLRGFRLRLPAAAVWQASGRALGASPMPIAFSEVYMALQQGIADGQENPVPVAYAKGFHEVQKYLSLTGHIQSSIQLLINERVWQRLTLVQQEAMQRAIVELGGDVLDGIRSQEAELLQEWLARDTMHIIDDVDVAAFERKARSFFADGFLFSPLYRKISSDKRGSQAARNAASPGRSEP